MEKLRKLSASTSSRNTWVAPTRLTMEVSSRLSFRRTLLGVELKKKKNQKKGVDWQWGPYQKEAFRQLKQKLCKAPILRFPDPKLQYTMVMDASGAAVGGVLMQDHGEGLQPLAFMSKALKASERHYSAYECELAAVAYCFLQWRHYLEGCPGGVNVVIDHQPLTLLMQ